jgi:hypothetical protein
MTKENKEPNQIKRNPFSLLLDLFYFKQDNLYTSERIKKQGMKIIQTLLYQPTNCNLGFTFISCIVVKQMFLDTGFWGNINIFAR